MQILGCTRSEAEKLIRNFYDGNPGLQKLLKYLDRYYQKYKYIRAIDNRKLYIRSSHVLLNSLIQASAAIIFKDWSCRVWEQIDANLFDAAIMIMYHDELQCRVHEDCLDLFVPMLQNTLTETQVSFNLNVDLKTDTKIGMNWRDCH